MAEGLDLGQLWTTIFIDTDYSSTLMYQALDRTERDLGATEPRRIIYLRCPKTVDDLIWLAVERKWNISSLVAHFLSSAYSMVD